MAKNVELLDNGNEILYPKTLAVQVAVNANKNLDTKLDEIDAKIKDVTDEVVSARNKTGNTYTTLKARLDAMEDTATQAQQTANTANTNATQANQTANTANNTANSVQTEINNAKGNSATLKDRIDSIDTKLINYLPLTGGVLNGALNANGGVSINGNPVWHSGNLQPSVDAVANTVVQRSNAGNITTGQIVNFQDTNQNRIGAITIEDTTRKIRHNHIPTGSTVQTAYDIHTQQTMPYSEGTFTPVVESTGGGTMVGTGTGYYQRIGNTVTIHCEINITGAGTVTGGNLTIGGLPFANGNTTNSTSGTFGDIQGFANYDIYPYLLANSHLIRIRRRNAQGVASYLPAMDVVGTTFAFSMTYVTN